MIPRIPSSKSENPVSDPAKIKWGAFVRACKKYPVGTLTQVEHRVDILNKKFGRGHTVTTSRVETWRAEQSGFPGVREVENNIPPKILKGFSKKFRIYYFTSISSDPLILGKLSQFLIILCDLKNNNRCYLYPNYPGGAVENWERIIRTRA